MSAFQDIRKQTEQRHIVNLLSQIDRNPTFTQRGLAAELGIALGLMNQYLKHCVSRGWLRVTKISPKRISYFVTPEGFNEKSRMVSGYMARSFEFFRSAKTECEEILELCCAKGWSKIGLFGSGDFADIAQLVLCSSGAKVEILPSLSGCKDVEAVIITAVNHPQQAFDAVSRVVAFERIITPKLLHISRRSEGQKISSKLPAKAEVLP